ncbi:MAG: hypothetical protein ACE5IY_13180 [bacterium]
MSYEVNVVINGRKVSAGRILSVRQRTSGVDRRQGFKRLKAAILKAPGVLG